MSNDDIPELHGDDGKFRYLFDNELPQLVAYANSKKDVRSFPTLAAAIGQKSKTDLLRERPSDPNLARIRNLYGIPLDSECWKKFENGNKQDFSGEFNKLHKDFKPTDASDEPLDKFDDMLASLSLWLSQERLTGADGSEQWGISFGLSSQPSPSVIDGTILVLKRAQVFISCETDGVVWHETCAANYDASNGSVTLKRIGDNVRPGRLLEPKPGHFIESVELPHDFYRVAGMVRGSLVRIWIAAYSKDLALEQRPKDVERAAADAAEASYSFGRLKDGKSAPLLGIEQQRLLKVIHERERQMRMGKAMPKVQQGWVVLHWVVKPHPYASGKTEE